MLVVYGGSGESSDRNRRGSLTKSERRWTLHRRLDAWHVCSGWHFRDTLRVAHSHRTSAQYSDPLRRHIEGKARVGAQRLVWNVSIPVLYQLDVRAVGN